MGKERYDQIIGDLDPFLKATGYKNEDITYIPISGLATQNIDEKVDENICDWYKGPALIELIDSIELLPRFPDGPLRIPILEKMEEGFKNPIAFGKIENGTLRLGD